MTAIDGGRQPGSIHGVAGATLDRLDDIALITGRSPSELVTLAVIGANFAPPVETRSAAAVVPGDRAGHRGTPPAPVAVSFPATSTYPLPHAHLMDGPCVFGDRCGR